MNVLKSLRVAAALTVRAAAKKVGVSHMTLSYAERGMLVAPKTVAKILKAYGHPDLATKAGICTKCSGTGRARRPKKGSKCPHTRSGINKLG